MENAVKATNQKNRFMPVIICGAGLMLASAITAIVFIILYFNGVFEQSVLQNGVVISVIVLLIGLAMLVTGIYNYRTAEHKKTRDGIFSTKNITRIAIMTALSYVLYMFVKFPLPSIFPVWLDIQISDVPALICGFMMGPASGCLVIFFKILLKLPFSSTVMVGELADFMIGIAFVLPASLIYKYHKSKKGAAVGLTVGMLASVGVAVLINWLILVPWFVELYFGGNWNGIVAACSGLYESVTVDSFYFWYLLCAALPFNLLRSIISALVTFLVYKSLGKLFNKMVPKPQN